VEPARSTLYRSYLLSAILVLVLLGAGLRLWAWVALGLAFVLLLVVSRLVARARVVGVRARRELYPSAFEEDEVPVDILLEGDRPARMLEVVDSFGPAISLEQWMLDPGPLEPGARRRLRYVSYCSRQWGVYTVGPLRVVGSDACGLFRSTKELPVVEEFAVFPRVLDVAGLGHIGARPTFAPQEATAGRPGQSLLYLGVRDYRPGDELRRVHWPASARRGALVVKEYEVDLCPYATVFVDLERKHRAGTGKKSTMEYVVRTAASVVWTAIRSGSFVQVTGLGSKPLHVPPGRGEDHLAFALYELIRAQQDGATPLTDVVLHHLPVVPPQSTAILVSGTVYLDLPALEEILAAFRDRGVRAAVILVNNHSFPAISGWPPPRAAVLEKSREVTFFLRSRGVPVRVLEESDELGEVLGREGVGP
jgi:uncharacterized protein (DUF58 family)